MEKWDYCVQGQGHSEALICQGIFVWMIFSPCVSLCLLNISLTAQPFFLIFFLVSNLVWWCIIMRQRVLHKNWFTIFNVKVTARAYIIKI